MLRMAMPEGALTDGGRWQRCVGRQPAGPGSSVFACGCSLLVPAAQTSGNAASCIDELVLEKEAKKDTLFVIRNNGHPSKLIILRLFSSFQAVKPSSARQVVHRNSWKVPHCRVPSAWLVTGPTSLGRILACLAGARTLPPKACLLYTSPSPRD